MPWKSKGYARTQALPANVNDVGREALRALIDARWDGNSAAAAREIGVAKSTLHFYLSGDRGAGAKLAHLVMQIDPSVGLAILGADMPLLRSAPWVSQVASRLVREDGASAEQAGWAIMQALLLGRGKTEDDLRDAALSLVAMRRALTPKS